MNGKRIVCECGGTLPTPVPRRCPHCGATILSVRRRGLPRVGPLLIVAAMFAALVAFLWWML
jgi:hypothetical protein